MTRTLLLGIDGADLELIEEFDLPNLESIPNHQEIDTHGNSGPSWASLMTGLRPRQHNIGKIAPDIDRESWQGTPIWEKIKGYCGIANVPMTYPPVEIQGWLVCGMMTPRNAIYTYPPDRYKELDDLGYEIDVWVEDHQNHPHGHYGTVPFSFEDEYREELLDRARNVIERRGEAFVHLLEEHPVDFAFLCFTVLDRVQHLAFHDKDVVRSFYWHVDDAVGRVLDSDMIRDSTEIFVTSDHGFQEVHSPKNDLTGEHRVTGWSANNVDASYVNLETLHERVVESANRSDVEGRLRDLGYLED